MCIYLYICGVDCNGSIIEQHQYQNLGLGMWMIQNQEKGSLSYSINLKKKNRSMQPVRSQICHLHHQTTIGKIRANVVRDLLVYQRYADKAYIYIFPFHESKNQIRYLLMLSHTADLLLSVSMWRRMIFYVDDLLLLLRLAKANKLI